MDQNSRSTNKSICNFQNEDRILKCLAAQRQAYSTAKILKRRLNIVTVIYMLFTIFASWNNEDWSTATATLLAVSIAVVTKYILIKVNAIKKTAASIQQYIDAKLYSFLLDVDEETWGDLPSHSTIAEATSNIKVSNFDDLKNWYSDYSLLTPEEQVYRMQQENIRWDYELRKKYRIAMICIAAAIVIAIVLGFIFVNPSFVRAICIFSWLIPVFDFYWCELKDLNRSINRLKNLKVQCIEVERCIEANVYGNIINQLLGVQDEIFKSREEGYLISDWFYNLDKKKRQEREDGIAAQISDLNNDEN